MNATPVVVIVVVIASVSTHLTVAALPSSSWVYGARIGPLGGDQWYGWGPRRAVVSVVASTMAGDVPGTCVGHHSILTRSSKLETESYSAFLVWRAAPLAMSCEHVQQVHSGTGIDDVAMIVGAVAIRDILLLVGDTGFCGRTEGSSCEACSHGSCVAVRGNQEGLWSTSVQ
ncbi:hypothetical protein EDB83DRAFT_2331260 [Lactarius deliciosus]|nr:hypothetical protein EDB83DRAFT_2331260 [Lactarius deliciosus]